MSALDPVFVKATCRPGTSECCRYLIAGEPGFACAKLAPGMRAQIDQRVAAGTFRAIGDNCPGMPPFTPKQETIH